MFLRNLTVPVKILVLTGVFSAGLIGYGVWTHNTLDEAKVTGPLYQDIVQSKDLLADILPPPHYIIESYLTVRHLQPERLAEQHIRLALARTHCDFYLDTSTLTPERVQEQVLAFLAERGWQAINN